MEGLYFSATLGNGNTLCLSSITERRLAMAAEPVADARGYFLYELTGSGESAHVEILGHIVSEEAVHRLREMLKLE